MLITTMTVYPQPDEAVAKYLTEVFDTEAAAKLRHIAFLSGLFDTAARYLQGMNPDVTYQTYDALALAWRTHLESKPGGTTTVREKMYADVIKVCTRNILSCIKQLTRTICTL